VHSKYTTN